MDKQTQSEQHLTRDGKPCPGTCVTLANELEEARAFTQVMADACERDLSLAVDRQALILAAVERFYGSAMGPRDGQTLAEAVCDVLEVDPVEMFEGED